MNQEKRELAPILSAKELIVELMELNPVDLFLVETTEQEALNHCKNVLKIILRAEKVKFSKNERGMLNDVMSIIGCINKKCDENSLNKRQTLDQVVEKNNKLKFPLTTFNQLTEDNSHRFMKSFTRITKGGFSDSPAGKWLQAQETDSSADIC